MRIINALLLLSFTLLLSCANRSQYGSFAEAGIAYTRASDAVLDASTELKLSATSDLMLDDRKEALYNLDRSYAEITNDKNLNEEQKEKHKKDALDNFTTKSTADYNQKKQDDQKRVQIMAEIKTHNALLRDYFTKLVELSSDNPVEGITNELKAAGESLEKVTKELKVSAVSLGSPVESIGNFVVDAAIRTTLRKELVARGNTIRHSLFLQEQLLQSLAKSMKNDTLTVSETFEKNSVLTPFIEARPIKNEVQWKKDRATVIRLEFASEELLKASKSTEKLRKSFEDVMTNKFNLAALDTLVTDAEVIYKISEEIRNFAKQESKE